MRLRRAAVVSQRAEQRIDVQKIASGAEPSAVGRVADQIVALAGNGAVHVGCAVVSRIVRYDSVSHVSGGAAYANSSASVETEAGGGVLCDRAIDKQH